ncbi:hypothetical protein SAMN02745857_03189 [Andreprevotia lacus DSM 23236]|uniref:Uncharacterized protein n=1 Tax=Andreprevotia lacus DSM 23236 TaxID=1121001 RepID=A0A1W1XXP0_9NEIS|nr:hypothetical protein SAMN02745857_03189 [Andreprevotia lacus DSM 23236]
MNLMVILDHGLSDDELLRLDALLNRDISAPPRLAISDLPSPHKQEATAEITSTTWTFAVGGNRNEGLLILQGADEAHPNLELDASTAGWPTLYSLHANRGALMIGTPVRLQWAAERPAVHRQLRQWLLQLAPLARSTTAIYLGDNATRASGATEMIWEGESYQTVCQYLSEYCGPPWITFSNLSRIITEVQRRAEIEALPSQGRARALEYESRWRTNYPPEMEFSSCEGYFVERLIQ